MISTQPPSGCRDFLYHEASRRLRLIELISKTYQSFGFQPLITSALENVECLMGSGGEENEKLIFKILKRGEKLEEALKKESALQTNDLADLGLRFDLTVPLARVVAQYQNKIPFPWKVFQVGNVWRAERPQKGRFREFVQCDVDILGASSLAAESEVIQAVAGALRAVEANDFNLHLNDRRLLPLLAERGNCAIQPFSILLDKKDKISLQELERELAKLSGGNISSEIKKVLENKFTLEEAASLNKEVASHLKSLLEQLEKLNLNFSNILFDPTLARGMGYYTGTIFELRHRSAGYSLGGGGRYDHLIERFSKQSTPACGFSIGFDRLLLLLEEQELKQRVDSPVIFMPVFSEMLRVETYHLASTLRKEGFQVDVYADEAKLKTQFKFASDQGYRWVLIAGEDEFKTNEFKVKDFKTSQEQKVKKSDLMPYLKNLSLP